MASEQAIPTLPSMEDVRNAVSRKLPVGWGFAVHPCGEIDNPTDLTERGIYGLAFDADGAVVDLAGGQWVLFRFHRLASAELGALLFVWGDAVRAARDRESLDRLVVAVIEAGRRRFATLEGAP